MATPFLLWFVWRAWARRNGREPGATPWTWLFAAGAILVGLSLMASALFHTDNRGQTYVPGEVGPDGRVTEGRYENR
jgi:nicotinamide riboside transporter PnuC